MELSKYIAQSYLFTGSLILFNVSLNGINKGLINSKNMHEKEYRKYIILNSIIMGYSLFGMYKFGKLLMIDLY